jgi:hypothetical protein
MSRVKLAHGFTHIFLSHRTQLISLGNSTSCRVSYSAGVPQGLVLGHVHFSLSTTTFRLIIEIRSASLQKTADDTQLFISLSAAILVKLT